MSKVAPFYSIRETARKVYYDNDKCTEGNNIESYNIRPGTAGRPRCEQCTKLEREGK